MFRARPPAHAAYAAILGLFAVLGPSPARAQDSPPAPADAMRLYERVAGWVRTWTIPAGPGTDAPAPGLTAVAITLRQAGAIAGRGIAIAEPGTDGAGALAAAAAQAMTEAAGRLPVEKDALHDENLRAAASQMTISLELAGPMVPIAPAEWIDAATELSAGIHGVAARLGDRTAAMFPGAMTAGGMDPGRGLAAAVSRASGDPSLIIRRPADLAADLGAVFYRFRTTHLAQPAPGEPPIFLHRAGRIVEMRELSETELRRWADGLADNLVARRWPGVEKYGLQGAYDPVKGTYEEPFAGPAEQALAIIALNVRVQQRQTEVGSLPPALAVPPADEPAHPQTIAAVVLLDALMTVEPGEREPWADPVSASAAYIALRAVRVAAGDAASTVPDETVNRLLAAMDGAYTDPGGWVSEIPPAGRALIAAALATRLGEAPAGAESDRIEQLGEAMIRSLFRDTPPAEVVTLMPFLGSAELHRDALRKSGIPSALALRQMRTMVWTHQLRAVDLPQDQRDLAGGIVFTASKSPLPTWQSARPLAFIAAMLGDSRLTDPGERSAELVRLLTSLRFLRQLSASEAEGHMYAAPARAMWGVRAGLWDQRQPVEATAMTLLAVCETLRSLEALKTNK